MYSESLGATMSKIIATAGALSTIAHMLLLSVGSTVLPM